MNNNIFDIQRFGKLIKREWLNPKHLKLGNFIPALLPVLYLLITILNNNDASNSAVDRANILLFTIIVLVYFSPFILFGNINHPKKGIIDTMLPASSLEKFLLMQITGLILVPVYILVTYGFVDTILSTIFPKVLGGYAIITFFEILDYNWEKSLILFGIFQSILFCNLWFKTNKILKTIGAFSIFGGVMLMIAILLVKIFIEKGIDDSIINYNISFDGSGSSLMIRSGDHPALVITQLSRIFIDIIMPIGLTIGSYFMLKTRRY